ncbi:signal peptidase I [Actinocorallia lasiicapitis]
MIAARVLFVTVLVTALAAGVAVAAVAVLSIKINGHSMAPTLANGERVFTAPGSEKKVARFDVVLLRAPGRGEPVVKRVIALPGDRVQIGFKGGDPLTVLVQPKGETGWFQVVSDAWRGRASRVANCCEPDGHKSGVATPQTVPDGRFFYLGDNPDVSDDSRTFGWGEISTVSGRVAYRVWPWNDLREIGGRPTLVPTTRQK